MTAAIPAPEAFTIYRPVVGWGAEMLTTAEDLEYMVGAYHAQRGRHPGVAMSPATWAIVSILFHRLSWDWEAGIPLRVVLPEQHDPGTITFFDDDEISVGPLGLATPG